MLICIEAYPHVARQYLIHVSWLLTVLPVDDFCISPFCGAVFLSMTIVPAARQPYSYSHRIYGEAKENSPEALEAVGDYITLYNDKIQAAYDSVNRECFASYVDKDIFDMTVFFTMKGILEEEYAKEEFDEANYMNRIRTFLEQMRRMSVVEDATQNAGESRL